MQTRLKVIERFRITGRGEAVIYEVLDGTVQNGMVLTSLKRGDNWRISAIEAFGIPPPQDLESPRSLLFRPMDAEREIEAGEVFLSSMPDHAEVEDHR